jgi:hypothetical protein
MSTVSHIPEELRALARWCVWKLEKNDGRSTKIPYHCDGSRAESDKLEAWETFDDVKAAHAKGGYSGIGLLIAEPYAGIDFDEVVELNSMTIHPVVMAWINKWGSYAEYSPSCFNETKARGGVKVWVKGVLPEPLPDSGPRNKLKQIEIYSCLRYFTMTGAKVPGTPPTVNAVDLAEFYHQRKAINASLTLIASMAVPASARISSQEKMLRLGRGEWKDLGYESQSSADLAYVGHLAKACNGDAAKIDANFRLSGLMRDKWNEMRGEKTYGVLTVESALRDFKKIRRLLLNAVKAVTIEATITKWIWPGFIPLGKTWLGVGGPGVGKSTVTTDIAARASAGAAWPDGQPNLFGACEVLIVTFSEDTYSDVVIPGLMVHGADLDKIWCIKGVTDEDGEDAGSFKLEHLGAIRAFIEAHPAIKILLINPLAAGFGKGKMVDQQDVREKLDGLNKLADELQITPMIVHHDKKGLETSAVNKSSGSQQISGAARAHFHFVRGKRGEPSSMASAKINISKDCGLKFEIVKSPHPLGREKDIHNIGIAKVRWLGKQDKTADELLEDAVDPAETKGAKAKQFIKASLVNGPQPAKMFWDWARGLGGNPAANQKVMQRAKQDLDVVDDQGSWSLPQEVKTEEITF